MSAYSRISFARKNNSECQSAAGAVVNRYGALVQQYGILDDRQTETRAASRARTSFVDAVETLEEVRQML